MTFRRWIIIRVIQDEIFVVCVLLLISMYYVLLIILNYRMLAMYVSRFLRFYLLMYDISFFISAFVLSII